MSTNPSSTNSSELSIFRISPLIRLTLLALYLALTVPLPFLAIATSAPVSSKWLILGLGIGLIALYAALSERVVLDSQGISVNYPQWVPPIFRQGWAIAWSEIKALKPRTTGQGGIVYYFLSNSGQGYLLPMRVAGFTRLVAQVEAKTGIDTRDVKPLAQPWMYFILLGLTLLLLLMDIWVITTAIALNALR
jgi:hypothetical protein